MSRFGDSDYDTSENRSHRSASAWVSPSDAYHMQFDDSSQTGISRHKPVPFDVRFMLWLKEMKIQREYERETDPERKQKLKEKGDELYLKRRGFK